MESEQLIDSQVRMVPNTMELLKGEIINTQQQLYLTQQQNITIQEQLELTQAELIITHRVLSFTEYNHSLIEKQLSETKIEKLALDMKYKEVMEINKKKDNQMNSAILALLEDKPEKKSLFESNNQNSLVIF